jgi:glycosyltransferase involved in cell wall biosynthesis
MNILAYVHLRNIYGSTGAGRLARNMIEKLSSFEQDKIVILADREDHRKIIPLVQEPWNTYDYSFIQTGTSRQQVLWALTNRPKAETYWREAQIVYCTGESYVPVDRAALAVTVHDAAFFETTALRQDWETAKQTLKWRYLYHKFDRYASRLLTVSSFSLERIAHFFPSVRDRLRVVPSAVPERFFQPVSVEGELALAHIGLSGRRFVLLPRGLHFRKNAELVLKAWPKLKSKHKDLILVISGHCEEQYIKQAHELGPSVQLTGFIDDELLCSLYSAATVVWFPSLYEGFGLPPLEAMACGTPVVASNTSSIPEVTGGAAILVSPSAVHDHVDALDLLLCDDHAAQAQIEAGRARASVFTWEAAARKLRFELSLLT